MNGDKISSLPINENEKIHEDDQQLLDILLEDKKEQVKEEVVKKKNSSKPITYFPLSMAIFKK